MNVHMYIRILCTAHFIKEYNQPIIIILLHVYAKQLTANTKPRLK